MFSGTWCYWKGNDRKLGGSYCKLPTFVFPGCEVGGSLILYTWFLFLFNDCNRGKRPPRIWGYERLYRLFGRKQWKTLENASTCFLVLDRVVLQRKRCSDLFEVKGKGLSEFVFDTANSYLCFSINFSFRITWCIWRICFSNQLISRIFCSQPFFLETKHGACRCRSVHSFNGFLPLEVLFSPRKDACLCLKISWQILRHRINTSRT